MTRRRPAHRAATRRYVVVLVTCPRVGVARRIGTALIERRLAACVNLLPGLESVFRWQGKVDRANEVLLVIKTTSARLTRLEAAVAALHPYEVPEIIALPLIGGHPPYLRWIADSVSLSHL